MAKTTKAVIQEKVKALIYDLNQIRQTDPSVNRLHRECNRYLNNTGANPNVLPGPVRQVEKPKEPEPEKAEGKKDKGKVKKLEEMTREEIKAEYNVKQLKSIAKQMEIPKYYDLLEDQLVDGILEKLGKTGDGEPRMYTFDNSEGKEVQLIGSTREGDTVEIAGKEIELLEVINVAKIANKIENEDWNNMDQADREKEIDKAIDFLEQHDGQLPDDLKEPEPAKADETNKKEPEPEPEKAEGKTQTGSKSSTSKAK